MTQKPRTFFTADQHFGHVRAIELCKRPFQDVGDMNRQLIDRWNAVVQPDDEIWHLGDFAYKMPDDQVSGVWHRLNGVKHLVAGNHDNTATRELPWASKQLMTEISVGGQNVVLCHYPLLEWRGFHRGTIHLFGHVHGKNSGVGRSCDVGVDVWNYQPASLDQVLARIGDRT